MELLLSSYSLFFSLCLPILLCIIFLKQKNASKTSLNLPPGPRPLPFIGNLHHVIGSLPHQAARDLSKQYGPLIFLKLGEIPTIIFSSPDTIREMMKTHDIAFSSRPISTTTYTITYGGKGILYTPYGEYWRHVRKISMTELLSTKRVQSFRSIREEEVDNLIRQISLCSSQAEVVNLSKMMSLMVNDMVARVVLGSKCKSQDMFLRALAVVVELMAGLSLDDIFPSSRILRWISGGAAARRAERSHRVMDSIIDDVIKEYREQKREKKKEMAMEGGEQEALVGVLLRLYDEGTLQNFLDMDTIKSVIIDLFMAGSETSSTFLEWVMAEFIRNPKVMKKAQLEVRELFEGCTNVSESDLGKLSYLQLVIKETLRLHPPVPLNGPRLCRETCRISGYDIPKGATVLVNMWAVGRDPKNWEDPEDFKPERFANSNIDFKGTDFELVPFGGGRRICPGLALGVANVELPLASLLYHFDWKLPDGIKPEELDMSESFGITARRKMPLELLAVPYKLSSVA